MAINITVEDGSLIADANSYVGPDDVITYAANRGVDLTDNEELKAWIIVAADYLNTYGARWRGTLVSATQSMQWPRYNAWRDDVGNYYATNVIPTNLMAAQSQLVMAQSTGLTLMPNDEGGSLPVIREKVDVLETQYATPKDAGFPDTQPNFPAVDALLAPLINAGGFKLRSVRI